MPLSDEELLSTSLSEAEALNADSAKTAAKLLKSLSQRDLYSPLSTRFYDDLPADVVTSLEARYETRELASATSPAENRSRVLRVLEGDFKLPAGALVMYIGGTNPKIAKVQIAVGDEVDLFADYERRHNDQLAGGHLDAQLRRFRRLWRIHFFIDSKLKASLGERLFLLQAAIEKLALGNLVDGETPEHAAHALAASLISVGGDQWVGMTVKQGATVAAYQTPETATGSYPFGAPSLSSCLSKA